MITQIYCIRSVEEALEVIEAGASHLGIMPPQRITKGGIVPGELTEDMTFDILKATKGKAKRVLILVCDVVQDYYDCVEKYEPDVIHFSGDELVVTEEISQKIKSLVPGILIEQAVGVKGNESIEIAKERAKFADLLILDSVAQEIEGIGASGVAHDWSIDKAIIENVDIPVIMAGGLSPDNVADAIRAANPAGVDSLTKTDKTLEDGSKCKDIEKVRKFCEIANSFGE